MTRGRSRGRPPGPAKPFEPFPLPGLRAARLEAGDNLARLGELIGVNKGHASKIELGQVRLDVERALTLARHYGLPVESFPGPDLGTAGAMAQHVADVIEEAAARHVGVWCKLAQYQTESGLVTCVAIAAPFRFAWGLEGQSIARGDALRLIEERLRARGIAWRLARPRAAQD